MNRSVHRHLVGQRVRCSSLSRTLFCAQQRKVEVDVHPERDHAVFEIKFWSGATGRGLEPAPRKLDNGRRQEP